MEIRIDIRPFRADDLEPMHAWAQDPAIRYNFRFTAVERTIEDSKRFLTAQMNRPEDADYQHFVLYDKTDPQQRYLGSVGLKSINTTDNNAELAIVISDEKYRGQGLGKEALYLMCKHGFEKLNLHKIYLTCISHNTGAIKAYEKFGFVHEGLRREQIRQNGEYYDEIMMGMLSKEFEAKY